MQALHVKIAIRSLHPSGLTLEYYFQTESNGNCGLLW